MGGRGQNYDGYAERKKKVTQINNSIKSLQKQIKKHQEKIEKFKNSQEYQNMSQSARDGRIHHWEAEIATFKNNIAKAKAEKKQLK